MPRKLIERLWSRGKEFLGVEYPVLGGAMTWISESTLVSTISNAGAFGVLAGGNMPLEMLKDEIKRTRDKTDKPFGVNSVGIAQNLIKGGVDALVIEGHEAGGHIGPISTAVLAEQILPQVDEVPVFVAGGIGSGVMMVHYLMMGAAGVQLGTKFAVAKESVAHDNFKRALLRAAAKDAVSTAQFDPRMPVIPVRALVNEGTLDFNTLQLGLVAQLERKTITAREAGQKLEEFWIGGLRRAAIDGDVKQGSLMAGQSVGLVKEILPVREILDQLIEEGAAEAEKILKRLGR